jgi:hypothetical protein
MAVLDSAIAPTKRFAELFKLTTQVICNNPLWWVMKKPASFGAHWWTKIMAEPGTRRDNVKAFACSVDLISHLLSSYWISMAMFWEKGMETLTIAQCTAVC